MKQTKWEYKIYKLGGSWDANNVEQALNRLGQEGWEAVNLGWMVKGPSGDGDAAVLLKRAR